MTRRRLAAALVLLPGCRDPQGPDASDTGSSSAAATTGVGTLDDTTAAPPRSPAPLLDNTAWQITEADDDPLPVHRPARVDCGPVGAYVEGNGLEIDTGRCNYLARTQPSLVEVRAGDTIAVSAHHATLASVEAGQAHFALLLGPTVVWQDFVPIPAYPGIVDATPYQEQVVVDLDAPVGTPVGLHLHNHGYNTWTLLEVEVRPSD